ncbi:sulfite exporter TauE/SafE family protein [Erysipelothrix urinaevulpis]|uniref:sulfite exporter TauE/SafE family protein n=1 Tax=Erysipelothrix urinaevulpis TaxID=2683717 RepID=UPI0013593BA0|nr:sulfite exporter TauE/SafE family protein [Erysipelothrix urinaevulpis]
MIKLIIYALVIVSANILGAISGLGGGSIIKPVFDFLGFHSLVEISFYSSVAVFIMAIASTIKQIQMKSSINYQVAVGISSGSIIGGVLGSIVFASLLNSTKNELFVNLIQIIIIIITLIFSYLYSKQPVSLNLTISYGKSISIGVVLGFLASFLGIGGGPLNVALLMLIYALSIKEATIYSILSIIFSQGSKLLNEILNASYLSYDLKPLPLIIVSALIGGTLGAYCNKKCNSDTVKKVYQSIIAVIFFINITNAIKIIGQLF